MFAQISIIYSQNLPLAPSLKSIGLLSHCRNRRPMQIAIIESPYVTAADLEITDDSSWNVAEIAEFIVIRIDERDITCAANPDSIVARSNRGNGITRNFGYCTQAVPLAVMKIEHRDTKWSLAGLSQDIAILPGVKSFAVNCQTGAIPDWRRRVP